VTDELSQVQGPTVWVEPKIPTKWEIIPIHNSDRANFRRCRRYWDWSSPSRTNLTVRADIHGINIPMFFGTGIHYALEQYYNPVLKRDPVEAFKTWFDVMWRGGTVTEEWLDKVYDLKPRPVTEAFVGSMDFPPDEGTSFPLYQVRGLEDILPDPDHAEWDELFALGVGMMNYYKEYAEINDDFTVVVAEHDFSVPIWDYEYNRILQAFDTREDSPNYGKQLEVHARGRMDAVAIRPNGKMPLLENKTATKWGEDELRKLESDEQCTHYLWCAEVEATYYDLPHKGEPLEEVVYNVLRKAYPRPPTELKSGMFSTDRQNEATTAPMLEEWSARTMPGIPLNEKQQGYLEYLRELGDENFIVRKPVRRNRHQLRSAGFRLYLETLDMLDPNLRIYPNISNSYKCLNCAFRPPCMAKEDGSDWEELIKSNYTTNKDR
jgi:hypothetical protein